MIRASALRKELAASRHIPYAALVSPEVILNRSGDYVQSFRLAGLSFESADDDTLNNWHERLNVTWRNIASPNLGKRPAITHWAWTRSCYMPPVYPRKNGINTTS